MTEAGYLRLNKSDWADLSPAEFERFDVIIGIIHHYAGRTAAEKDLFIRFPTLVENKLEATIRHASPSDFPKALFLRLVMSDMKSIVVSDQQDSFITSDWLDRLMHTDTETHLLSSLFCYFLTVTDAQPVLQKRCYINLLTMFLSQLVVEEGVTEKMNVFSTLHNRLIQLPTLGFEHLYTLPPRLPESLGIGITLLRCLSKGYPLPNTDLAAILTCQGEIMHTSPYLTYQLLNPGSEDVTVSKTQVVLLSRDPLHQDERRQKLTACFETKQMLLLSDIMTTVVHYPYESERVAGFVLRRLADIIAHMLNTDTLTFSCEGQRDIYPWLIQYRQLNKM